MLELDLSKAITGSSIPGTGFSEVRCLICFILTRPFIKKNVCSNGTDSPKNVVTFFQQPNYFLFSIISFALTIF